MTNGTNKQLEMAPSEVTHHLPCHRPGVLLQEPCGSFPTAGKSALGKGQFPAEQASGWVKCLPVDAGFPVGKMIQSQQRKGRPECDLHCWPLLPTTTQG